MAAPFLEWGDYVRKLMWFAIGFCSATIACVYGFDTNFAQIAFILLPAAIAPTLSRLITINIAIATAKILFFMIPFSFHFTGSEITVCNG